MNPFIIVYLVLIGCSTLFTAIMSWVTVFLLVSIRDHLIGTGAKS